jgi:arylsulfatase A-like enzyme
VAVGCRPGGDAPEVAAPPNVLVISLCSVRADHMSLYGYPRRTTPSLEQFAAGAYVFTHAVTPWPKTTPAFAALVTGKYGHDTGVMRVTGGSFLEDSHRTVAEILRERGYATGAFISSGALSPETNVFQQGFDHVVDTWRLERTFPATTEHALRWIREQGPAPFLAWVHYNNAHQPYYAPEAPKDLFVDDRYYDGGRRVRRNDGSPLDLPVPADHPHRLQILRPDMWTVRPDVVLPDRPEQLDFYIARYDGGIFGADRMIGELLAGLRSEGLLDNAVVAVVGDHGEGLGDHGYYFGHGRLPYDDVARVPLVIRPAVGGEGRRVTTPVSTLGLAPTLLELVGAPAAEGMAVGSLLPLARGEARSDLVFAEAGYSLDYPLTVRDERWKLIFVPNPVDQSLMRGRRFELYDLASDPGETRDVFAEGTEVADRLQRALLLWSRGWIREAYQGVPRLREIVDEETRRELEALGYLN